MKFGDIEMKIIWLWELIRVSMVDHWLCFLPMTLVAAVVLLRVGSGLGVDRVFWNDSALVRWKAGLALGFLVVCRLVVGFLLNFGPAIRSDGYLTENPFAHLWWQSRSVLTVMLVVCGIAAFFGHKRTHDYSTNDPGQLASSDPKGGKLSDWQLLAGFVVVLGAYLAPVWLLAHWNPVWIHHTQRVRILGELTVVDASAAVLTISCMIYWLWRMCFDPSSAAPGVAICSLASFIILVGGMLLHLNQLHGEVYVVGAVILAALMLWVCCIKTAYSYQISGLHYPKPDEMVRLADANIKPIAPTRAGTPSTGHDFPANSKKLPLVIVCCTGGGIRAAVWTLRCLMRLNDARDENGNSLLPDFNKRIRLIFGASGGMLGATRYVTWLADGAPGCLNDIRDPELIRQVEKDGLSRLTSQLFFHDMPGALVPMWGEHRGNIIEDNWRENFGWPEFPTKSSEKPAKSVGDSEKARPQARTFGQLVSKERGGEIPSLVFSPMMVEDGRRLLISNLDLSDLIQYRGPELKETGAGNDTLYSQSAVEFRNLFDAEMDDFSLLSAVRMNASFPYVMPASSLPTLPRRRAVDAGYYDDYGIGLATDWLQTTVDDPIKWDWLMQSSSGVLVVQIRDGVLNLTQPMEKTATVRKEGKPSLLTRPFEQLMAPIQALFGFRTAVQLFHNDARLSRVLGRLNRETNDPNFATSVAFEFGLEASLTWALSAEELGRLKTCAESQEFTDKLKAINQWWLSRAGSV